MLEIFVSEFLNIMEHVVSEGLGVRQKDGSLAVDKELIMKYMRQNMYEESTKKLWVWRGLNWIITEDNRFTKLCRASENEKKYKRMIAVDMKVYETLKSIITTG